MQRFILASASPRRRDLLNMLGIVDFRVVSPEVDEEAAPGARPDEVVLLNAGKKAFAVPRGEEDIIIAADTIVYLDGDILGKPVSEAAAFSMLSRLSGRVHEVYTGVSVIYGSREVADFEMTKVFFRKISPDEITEYIKTGEPMDKAGGYGVQGRAALFVEKIEGDFFNVMGLPLCRLGRMLEEVGVPLFCGGYFEKNS